MATAEIILLSSSPARPHRWNAAAMASSPDFPCLKDLTQKRATPLRTGSRAAPIPQNAKLSFTSAASFLPAGAGQEGNTNAITDVTTPETPLGMDEPSKTAKPQAVRKPRVIKPQEDGTLAVKKPRKSRAKKVNVAAVDGAESKETPAPKEKPVRRPRVKKADLEGQTKLPKGKVTKASASKEKSTENKPGTSKKRTEKFSNHFATGTTAPESPLAFPLDDEQMPEAGKRRVNWTPPKDTQDKSSIIISGINDTSGENTQKGFSGLIGGWGYSNDIEAPVPVCDVEASGIRKRKLIELVKTNSPPSVESESVIKPKIVKKKPRTITDLATSAYRTSGEEEKTSAPAPLLQYLSYKNGEAATMESRTLEGFKIPAKPRNKSPVKTSSKALKPKQPEPPKLFSPQSALKRVEKQDFVFGTSSQLAREDSPALLRDLQKAMLESNRIDSDPFYQILDTPISERPQSCFIGEKGAVIYPGKRNLWSAGAYGESMVIETIDMTETPKTSKQTGLGLANVVDPEKQMVAVGLPHAELDDWCRLDDTPVGPVKLADTVAEQIGSSPWQHLGDTPIRSSKAVDMAPKAFSPSSTVDFSKVKAISPKSRATIGKSSKKDASASKPDFETYSTAQLAKEVASYRFKPIKNRNTMVALLEKCWEGTQRLALGTLGVNRAMSTSPSKSQARKKDENSKSVASPKRGRPRKDNDPSESPKRPVGRPRKESFAPESPKRPVGRPRNNSEIKASSVKASISHKVASVAHETNYLYDSDTPLATQRTPKKQSRRQVVNSAIDEISDSDAPSTPSPPRRRASKVGTPPKPLELASDNSVILSPTSRQLELHRHISEAITSAAPSKDSNSPSWHEKILLYDPIVLEDLTTWLNTGALQKVGWDGEVEPKEVKAWCLGKSICCLWRENLRGGARSRY